MTFAERVNAFIANPKAYSDDELWAIVRSTSVGTEAGCKAVSTAKTELRQRGFAVV